MANDYGKSEWSPATKIVLVTATDNTDIVSGVPTRGVSFGTAGALAVKDADGNDVTIPSGALVAGVIHPLRVLQVESTGTTATNIVAYY